MKKIVFIVVVCLLACAILSEFYVSDKDKLVPEQEYTLNPNNVLNDFSLNITERCSLVGVTVERNDDGSFDVFGASTAGGRIDLSTALPLTVGKTYTFTSNPNINNACIAFAIYDGSSFYASDVSDDVFTGGKTFKESFTVEANKNYVLCVCVPGSGSVVDATFYPVLVEGTEPGDFYAVLPVETQNIP